MDLGEQKRGVVENLGSALLIKVEKGSKTHF